MTEKTITFSQSIRSGVIQTAVSLAIREPWLALYAVRMARRQRRAEKIRKDWKARGLQVPLLLITSVTGDCNLRCEGCYAWELHQSPEPEMNASKLRTILGEARDLGVSTILLAGGEPLMRPELLETTWQLPELLFLLFTNGLLIDDSMVEQLKRQRHIVPIISLDGDAEQTDARRGPDTYERLARLMGKMKRSRIFFGTSLTLTRANVDTVLEREHLSKLISKGCRVFFFIEYIPAQSDTDDLVLTEDQQEEAGVLIERFRRELPALFSAFPRDEYTFGGCLAAGRGFVHINPQGDVEPCPFTPLSDASLKTLSLREALQSPFLKEVRQHMGKLPKSGPGCLLWQHRDWLASVLESQAGPDGTGSSQSSGGVDSQ